MSRAVVIVGLVALGALSCGPGRGSRVAPAPQGGTAMPVAGGTGGGSVGGASAGSDSIGSAADGAAFGGVPYGGASAGGASIGGGSHGGASHGHGPVVDSSVRGATKDDANGGTAYGGAAYGGVLPQGAPLTWTVKVADNATSAPLPRISVTAVEHTWGCKTRELPDPAPDRDHHHHHRPPRTETYDCKGGKRHITKLTDASGTATLQLPHSYYQLGPIKHPLYFPTDFRDPMYQRIASSLVKTSITNGGASRLTEYRLFPYSALKVKTEAQAESLALQNPIVKKCLAEHPKLTHNIEKPSLMWRVQFLYPGAKNMVFLSTVDTISADVGFMGCWDSCCAQRSPSRFERRLTECAKLRGATPAQRKPWDCDTLAQDFVRLQDFYRRRPNPAEQQKYEDMYRAYEKGEK